MAALLWWLVPRPSAFLPVVRSALWLHLKEWQPNPQTHRKESPNATLTFCWFQNKQNQLLPIGLSLMSTTQHYRSSIPGYREGRWLIKLTKSVMPLQITFHTSILAALLSFCISICQGLQIKSLSGHSSYLGIECAVLRDWHPTHNSRWAVNELFPQSTE